ncbi:MAG: MarR family winged helix-turn-helix transcriptional regulator [Actinomycetota bacterium]
MGRSLEELELRVWWGLLRAHYQATRNLEAALARERGLSTSSYEVLLRLARSPDRAMRLSKLADSVLLQPSSITRMIDQLVARGLIERRRSPNDARGYLAVLTPAGLEALREASPVHARSIHEHLTGRLTEGQLRALAEALEATLEEEGRIPPEALASFLLDLQQRV